MSNILMIDDCSFILDYFQLELKRLNHRVLAVNQSWDFRTLYQNYKNNLNIIIMDILLNDVTGIDLCLEIRNENKNIPIIGMTGNINLHKEKYLELGFTEILEKPFKLSELIELINKYAN